MKMHSQKIGRLTVEEVTEGMKLLIVSEAKENSFTNDQGKEITTWSVTVMMPDGKKKNTNISAFSHDAIIDKFGDESSEWIGQTLVATIDNNPQWGARIVLKPIDDPKDMGRVNGLTSEQVAGIQSARAKEAGGSPATMDEPPFPENLKPTF